eukprot:scaffold83113_cov32-Tisochrysis_lutea.AAC.2
MGSNEGSHTLPPSGLCRCLRSALMGKSHAGVICRLVPRQTHKSARAACFSVAQSSSSGRASSQSRQWSIIGPPQEAHLVSSGMMSVLTQSVSIGTQGHASARRRVAAAKCPSTFEVVRTFRLATRVIDGPPGRHAYFRPVGLNPTEGTSKSLMTSSPHCLHRSAKQLPCSSDICSRGKPERRWRQSTFCEQRYLRRPSRCSARRAMCV